MKVIRGNLCDAKLKYIGQVCNCVAVHSHGLSKTIAERYPHSVVYEKRICEHGRKNFAIAKCRPQPGTIQVCEGDTTIIHMFSMFLHGRVGQFYNLKKFVETAENRLNWFKLCLKKLLNILI